MVDNNEILGQILQLGQTLNTFQVQTNAALNELRTEIKKSREIENEHWLENLRRWDENDKRWEENNRRWEENDKHWIENSKCWNENDKRWIENNKNWEKYEHKRGEDVTNIVDILWSFQTSIEDMFESDRRRLAKIEKISHL